MPASNSGPGGVRNLAAMFENKASDNTSTSPIRGRSPNGSVSSSQERPTSKVRANFVAVDKPGEEISQSSPRKQSDAIMEDPTEHAVTDTQGLGEILKGSPFIDDGKFGPPAQNSESNGVADRAAAMVKKMQQGNTEPAPNTHVELSGQPKKLPLGHGPPVHTPKAPPELTSAPKDVNKLDTPTKGPVVKPKGGVEKIKGIMASAAEAQKEREAVSNGDKQSEEASKAPAAAETAPKPKNGPPTLAHGVRPRGGISKIQGVMESAKQAREARAAAAKSMPQTDGAKDIKPPTTSKPRSSLPARKAPGTATAPTASSVAKTDESNSAETKPAEKKVSKIPPRVANVTTASQLAKKSSRASLNSTDGARSRTATRPADEGFLARMMRPTASSAQKTHDKVQVSSPPRPKQNTSKTLASRPSRRSLSQASDNKENETNAPAVPAIPSEVGDKAEQTES